MQAHGCMNSEYTFSCYTSPMCYIMLHRLDKCTTPGSLWDCHKETRRLLIIRTTIEEPSGFLFRKTTPLFEEKRHLRRNTLITD